MVVPIPPPFIPPPPPFLGAPSPRGGMAPEEPLPHPKEAVSRGMSWGGRTLRRPRRFVEDVPTPRDAVDGFDIVPNPREVMERIPSPGDVVSHAPTPVRDARGVVDGAFGVPPPNVALRRLPSLSTVFFDGPGPVRDIEDFVDRFVHRIPGPAGDFHTFRHTARQLGEDGHLAAVEAAHDIKAASRGFSSDMSGVVGERIPETAASIREHSRRVREDTWDAVEWGQDFAPEVLDAIHELSLAVADVAVGAVEDIAGFLQNPIGSLLPF